jgi:WD40 repeat protein
LYQGKVKVWDLTQKRVSSHFELPDRFHLVEFASNGTLAVVGADWTVSLWDAASGRKRVTLPRPVTGREGVIRFSPDGKILATGPVLWDATTGRELTRLDRPDGKDDWVDDLAFSPNTTVCYAAGSGQLRVYNVRTGGEQAVFLHSPAFRGLAPASGHDNDDHDNLYLQPTPSGIAFAGSTPDSRILAAEVRVEQEPANPPPKWSSPVDVKVWDVDTGRELAHLKYTAQPFISPDGKVLATMSSDGIRLWDVPPRKPIVSFLSASILILILCLTGCLLHKWLMQRRGDNRALGRLVQQSRKTVG